MDFAVLCFFVQVGTGMWIVLSTFLVYSCEGYDSRVIIAVDFLRTGFDSNNKDRAEIKHKFATETLCNLEHRLYNFQLFAHELRLKRNFGWLI